MDSEEWLYYMFQQEIGYGGEGQDEATFSVDDFELKF